MVLEVTKQKSPQNTWQAHILGNFKYYCPARDKRQQSPFNRWETKKDQVAFSWA